MEREIVHIDPQHIVSGQVVDGEIADIIGAKVKKGGPDWYWDPQGEGSEYGIVVAHVGDNWYNVHWFHKNGTLLDKNHNYRAGFNSAWRETAYDLLYY